MFFSPLLKKPLVCNFLVFLADNFLQMLLLFLIVYFAFLERFNWNQCKRSTVLVLFYSPSYSQNCIVQSHMGKTCLSYKLLVPFWAFVTFLKLLERCLFSAKAEGGIAPDRLAPEMLCFFNI